MTRYPLYCGLGGLQGRSARVQKISPLPGSDPQTIQPVAGRYTDSDIPANNPLVYRLWINSHKIRPLRTGYEPTTRPTTQLTTFTERAQNVSLTSGARLEATQVTVQVYWKQYICIVNNTEFMSYNWTIRWLLPRSYVMKPARRLSSASIRAGSWAFKQGQEGKCWPTQLE
jgi:hypothetical protein